VPRAAIALLIAAAAMVLCVTTQAFAKERKPMAEPFDHPVLQFWLKTTEAPGYDKAAAHDPHFEDKAVWPDELKMDGEPAYMRQIWPEARLLVWSRRDPDKKSGGQVSLMSPGNWLEGGRPAKRPPDDKTDVLFPSADKDYYVLCSHGNKYRHPLKCRHVTVGTNAHVSVFGCRPTGNWWIKAGGSIYERHGGGFKGSNHAFARNDNVPGYRPGLGLLRPSDWPPEQCPLLDAISQYIHMAKPGGSLEAVGNWSTTDQFHVDAGTLIVAPLSAVGTGGRATLVVHPEGVLQLQSGSVISKRFNQAFNYDAVVQGMLRAGSRDRPIRKDAILGLSVKDFVGDVCSLKGYRARLGLQVKDKGKVEVHSVTGTDARLVFQWHGIDVRQLYEPPRKEGDRGYEAWKLLMDGVKYFPRTITLEFPGDLQLQHVAFDDVCLGGIQGVTAEQVARWKDIEWRPRNQGPPDFLTTPCNWYQNLVCRQGWPTVQIPTGEPLMLELGTPSRNVSIHYTTDGSGPTPKSPKATGPIRVEKTTTLRARVFWSDRALGEPFRVDCLSPDKPLPAVKGGAGPGLYFRAGLWREEDGVGKISGKEEGSAPATGTVETVTAGPATKHGAGGNQAVELSGFLNASAEGTYGLRLNTDYQPTCEAYVDSVRVLSVDGRSKADECRLALTEGAHALRILYRRRWCGSLECRLEWKPPGAAWQEVPADAYSH